MLCRLIVAVLLLLIAAPCLPAQDSGSNPNRPPHGMAGPGIAGTITAIEGQTITLKTLRGAVKTVKTSNSTEVRRGRQPATLSDLKLGNNVVVVGDEKDGVWLAKGIRMQPDAAVLREELGKRFIIGEVKKIDETKLTILRPDGESQVIEVDEGTSFRNQKRESITLADIKTGDRVFGRGEVKHGVFVPQVLNLGDFMRMGGLGLSGAPQNSTPPVTGAER
jgi:Cu/Ag efflux protein CusF